MGTEKFKKALSKYERVGLDTMGFIYFLEEHPRFGALSEIIFERAEAKELFIISSVLVLVEVLTGYRKAEDEIAENEFKQMMEDFPNVEVFDVNRHLIDQIIHFRSKYNIKTPDAIHLATAVQRGAEVFITNDENLKRVKEINIMCLKDYI